ncbi:hypothetical protein NDU88_006890 [Pleurodeles waltl]|uniref:Uncharacterized protein n=1 Tax=Pleurodeles waltl TaxID=8319 RepID=A0AAV7U1E9_PLEWA|nr:hypothetical protein NDU88_006890 [Pleurodeles waltl]
MWGLVKPFAPYPGRRGEKEKRRTRQGRQRQHQDHQRQPRRQSQHQMQDHGRHQEERPKKGAYRLGLVACSRRRHQDVVSNPWGVFPTATVAATHWGERGLGRYEAHWRLI